MVLRFYSLFGHQRITPCEWRIFQTSQRISDSFSVYGPLYPLLLYCLNRGNRCCGFSIYLRFRKRFHFLHQSLVPCKIELRKRTPLAASENREDPLVSRLYTAVKNNMLSQIFRDQQKFQINY